MFNGRRKSGAAVWQLVLICHRPTQKSKKSANMGLRGMLLAPLVSILLGYALNRIPVEIVTESQFYKEDRFGLRSALQHAHEHVVSCLNALVSRVTPLKEAVQRRVTGLFSGSPPPPPPPPPAPAGDSKPTSKHKKRSGRGTATRLFTREELAEHDGSNPRKGPYLALLGQVFDVSRGRQHYGPGGGYAFFAGRDASRAFVSGDFSEAGLIDDVEGLSTQDYLGLDEWLQFYRKDYRPAGRLVGRFYDEDGRETEYYSRLQRWMAEAREQRRRDDGEKLVFPPCNSEWSQERGGRVYCSRRSGGVARDWAGVPREYFAGGKKRCACVRDRGAPSHGADPGTDRGDLDDPRLAEFPGCAPHADSCVTKA
ncbi:neuferricin-like isoform X2 [Pollicipes pollicipes]|uniref:neuferricin-like isoform X2 n=1 Tax=Pollicipes pollicipes TaxID=41117 RepID=UPI0018855DB1|nr:neuferricin-like isoform X2 [Pollicipes pollicipes]